MTGMLSKLYNSFLVLICTAKPLRKLRHESYLSNVTVLIFHHKKSFIICYSRHFTFKNHQSYFSPTVEQKEEKVKSSLNIASMIKILKPSFPTSTPNPSQTTLLFEKSTTRVFTKIPLVTFQIQLCFSSVCLSLSLLLLIRLWEIVYIPNHIVSILLWQYALKMNKLSLIPRLLAKYKDKFCLILKTCIQSKAWLWKRYWPEVFRDWCSLRNPTGVPVSQDVGFSCPQNFIPLPLTVEAPGSKLSTGTPPSQLICWLPVAIPENAGQVETTLGKHENPWVFSVPN